jgi:hypothetical protein
MEETKTEIMTTLEQTLRTSHDWAVNRINILNKKNNNADAESIRSEFNEWMNPDIDDHDVFSLEYIGDEDEN